MIPLLACLSFFFTLTAAATYNVTVTRVNRGIPLFTHESIFNYNFNPSFIPMSSSLNEQGLFVRVQSNASTNGSNPYSVTPSFLVYSKMENLPLNLNDIEFAPITSESIIIQPATNSSGQDKCGDEDPRIAYREKDGPLLLALHTMGLWTSSIIIGNNQNSK